MNRASRRQPPRKTSWAAGLLAVVGIAVALLAGALPAEAFDERIAFDPYTGLSIGGYDPVAYFTDNAARPGSPDHEVVVGDTYWHFVSDANAAAFKADPLAYVPAFGGYSPAAIARGIAVPGNPTLYALRGGRVYLFATTAERHDFLADPAAAIAAATEKWPEVLKLLAY